MALPGQETRLDAVEERRVRLTPTQRHLLQHLDGSHIHPELATLIPNDQATIPDQLRLLAQQSLFTNESAE